MTPLPRDAAFPKADRLLPHAAGAHTRKAASGRPFSLPRIPKIAPLKESPLIDEPADVRRRKPAPARLQGVKSPALDRFHRALRWVPFALFAVFAATEALAELPAPPSELAAMPVSETQIRLSWKDNSDNENLFKVQRKSGLSGQWTQVGYTTNGETTFTNSGLVPGTVYSFRVVSNHTEGDSSPSNEVSITAQAPPPPAPEPPSGMTAPGGPFQNPGVYSQIVKGYRYEWIPTNEVNFQILPDGKVKILAPATKRSANGKNECNRFIYDHTHTRLSKSDADSLFGPGLALPVGNYGFAILWLRASNYEEVLAGGWTLANNPATVHDNSTSPDYFNLSIVPVDPPPQSAGAVQEVELPYDLQRVSWLPHYQVLPYRLKLLPDRGFGITRLLTDIPLERVYQKVTQIQYMYSFLDFVPNTKKWKVMRAYAGDSVEKLIREAPLDEGFGYLSQMDEDFGALGEKEHLARAQEVLKGVYERFEKERGVTSPNQTRLYDDYFSDLGGFSNSATFRWMFDVKRLEEGLASEAAARKADQSKNECGYFAQGAYKYRNWMQGGYLDSFERIPEGMRIYNEIYNFEKRFMAAPDRKVAKMGWVNAEGVNSSMYQAGTDSRLHFPSGDILRRSEVAWPFHMMLDESFWTLLLGHDYYLWHSSVPMVTDLSAFGDSWSAGAGKTRWQPTGGKIVDYDPKNPSHPQRVPLSKGQFPNHPLLGESGAFAGAWLVSQITGISERTSKTIEYCPFTYKINGGATQNGYYDSDKPKNGSLGSAKLSRYGIANYGQANIVKTFDKKKPVCIYTEGANGAALIYHNVYAGLADVNDVTVSTHLGPRNFRVLGNSLHVFYVK